MNSAILMYVCAFGATVLAGVWFFAALNEKGVNPFDEIFGRYRKQSLLGLILLPVFVLGMIVHGSTKTPTNDVPGDVSSPTNAVPEEGSSPTNLPPPLMMVWPGPQTPDPWFDSGFTSNELAVGYALWRVGTNEVWNFDPMPGAHVVESWRLRGAADDWTVCATTNLGPVAMTTDGRVVTTNGVFAACEGRLALVPEANWALLGTNAPSRAWWAETPWESTVFTWQNALLGRDTNTPVSVQAEFTRDGDFIYRYDFASTGTNLTSELYYRFRPEDVLTSDRDNDGLPTHDEVTVYHTDPGLVDTDGDGLHDGEEVWLYGTDPTERSVPDEEILARVAGSATNGIYSQAWNLGTETPLTILKLWDGFAADMPEGMTNLVYERTLALGTANGWQQYFLSSQEFEAGDWDLRGMVLEWDDGCGNCGTATASPCGDSFPLTFTNSTVTIRLRAIGPKVRCPKPMYLIGYAPAVTVSGGTAFCDGDGVERVHALVAGDGGMTLNVTVDRSHRPCKAALTPGERALPGLADIVSASGGAMAYDGDENGGTITVTRPGCYQLPKFGVDDPMTHEPDPPAPVPDEDKGGKWVVCLDPSVDFSGEHKFKSTGLSYDPAKGDYSVVHYYPLDSMCLWRSWRISESGSWECECVPEVKAGGGADGLPFVGTSYEISADRSEATGIVTVYGQEFWRGTAAHSWRDVGAGGGVSTGSELLSKGDECDDCRGDCADGNCDTGNGTDLGSVKFRLSLGMPRRGQYSGFVYFESENPVAVTMGLFEVKARDDASVWEDTDGAGRTVSCYDRNGRRIAMAPIADGVRLTVTVRETDELEGVWDVFNAGGDTNVVRIIQKSRLDNVMSDETYACDEDGGWSKTDNVSGVVETLERVDMTNDPADGKLYETRTTYDADGNQLGCTYVESSRIGAFGNAVLRETYWEEDTGSQVKWREATYWNDPAHRDRHGQLKLLTGNCTAWEYHDYDTRGFETLRVEQRNGSSVPTEFPEAVAGELYWTSGLADAFVTVYDYTPLVDDDWNAADVDKVRCETRYVVRNGRATRIARTWTRYTHIWCNGYDAVKAETWRAASAAATRDDPANAYSYVITYSETEDYVPLVLRGEVAEELDENCVLTCHCVWEGWETVIDEAHKWYGGCEFPTYEVTERDLAFGNGLWRATHLADGVTVVDEESSAYDEKNRLRSTTYMDGTSLTNAWSCCRKLWSRDREDRTTLRSAETGRDRLYYAEEEVWLSALATNGGYRVTQHFFDGLGRETNTVVGVGFDPGGHCVATTPLSSQVSTQTKCYPLGGDDYSVAVDARGKMTTRERTDFDDRVESEESVYATAGASAPDMQTLTTQWRNGARVTVKSWDGKWTRETDVADYDADGCEVRYEIVESSDCGTVTNRIVQCDFFGRTVLEVVPGANGSQIETRRSYDGTASRVLREETDGRPAVTYGYDDCGVCVATEQDGIRKESVTTYEMSCDGEMWRVRTTTCSAAGAVNAVSSEREQLTGLSDALRSRSVSVSAGHDVTVAESYLDSDGRLVSVARTNGATSETNVTVCGISVWESDLDGIERQEYDALGRVATVISQSRGSDVPRLTTRLVYDVGGCVVTNSVDYGVEGRAVSTFAYDECGREVSRTDAMGGTVTTAYDAFGRVVSTDGDAYPLTYDYDTTGRRTSLSTTRNGTIRDVTSWTYDPATGLNTAKRYPDGSRIGYAYADNGRRTRTTWARGVRKENAYDASNRISGVAYSDGTPSVQYAYTSAGKVSEASVSGGVRHGYAYDERLLCTNESVRSDGALAVEVIRTFDRRRRPASTAVAVTNALHAFKARTYDSEGRVSGYALTNSFGRGVKVTLAYDGSRLSGMAFALPNGGTFSTALTRSMARPDLVTRREYRAGGSLIYGCDTSFDLLGRPVNAADSQSLARAYLYNRRSELTAATIGTNAYEYAYDAIGNRTVSSASGVTNAYAANCLNQYVQITRSPAGTTSVSPVGGGASSIVPVYDADGNLTSDDRFAYAYDAENRLVSVRPHNPTEGALAVVNAYDHRHRRVEKRVERHDGDGWRTAETHRFVYDGCNIVLELIASADGMARLVEYFWGNDLSGSEQGAGGVGGLLAVSIDGRYCFPFYDHNGNVIGYVSESGAIVAQYVYDPYGNVIAQYGTLADAFAFRFSTKYCDRETGMVGYQRRFYRPDLGRWLNRDPIEERGGENLYAFCGNVPVLYYDMLGMSFWDDLIDSAKVAVGLCGIVSGAMLGATTSWTGAGAVGGFVMVAIGLDQVMEGVHSIHSRVTGGPATDTSPIKEFISYSSSAITGSRNSKLEQYALSAYSGAQLASSCYGGFVAVQGVVQAVRMTYVPAKTIRVMTMEKNVIRYSWKLRAGYWKLNGGGEAAQNVFEISVDGMTYFEHDSEDADIRGDNDVND